MGETLPKLSVAVAEIEGAHQVGALEVRIVERDVEVVLPLGGIAEEDEPVYERRRLERRVDPRKAARVPGAGAVALAQIGVRGIGAEEPQEREGEKQDQPRWLVTHPRDEPQH